MDNKTDKGAMTDDLDPIEDAIERSPWCVLVPTTCPDDPDIHGPFSSYKEAEAWSKTFPDSIVRKMASPEFVALCRRQDEEFAAWKRSR